MYLKLFFFFCISIIMNAQNNPLDINALFTADPTARNWGDGNIWLYSSHDVPCMASYSAMNDWHVFSSNNGVDWTDYGPVLSLDKLNQAGWNVFNAWAPECVFKNGMYYFYFPVRNIEDNKWKIGVATSRQPQGPFEDPKPVVTDWGIDPAVLVDDDGRAYLYCQFKMGELNLDMTSVKNETVVNFSDVAPIPFKYYEGPFVFKRDKHYYYVCSSEGYKKLIYYMSDNPLGPWDYKGIVMGPDSQPAENNHCSIVQFKGEWVLFYHRMVCGKARKICADYLSFNEDGTMNEVQRTNQGISFK
jgi:beta-xylosidase